MVTNKKRLLKAVRLLDEIIEKHKTSKISASSHGPSRALLVRLIRVRELLQVELEHPDPNWRAVVAPLLREAARWLGEFVINNFQYLLRPRLRGHIGIDLGTWSRVKVLPA